MCFIIINDNDRTITLSDRSLFLIIHKYDLWKGVSVYNYIFLQLNLQDKSVLSHNIANIIKKEINIY